MNQQITSEKKVWGNVQHVFCSEACAVSILEVQKGFRCSTHYHEHRINRFVVHSGVIDVIVYGKKHRLLPGSVFDVPPMEYHSFEVIESGTIVEVYWSPPVRLDDIVRSDSGGPIDPSS